MNNPKINPYHFVPLGNGPDRSRGYPDRYRLRPGYISGVLVCELEALSPLISLDQRCIKHHDQSDSYGRITETKIRIFKFLRSSNGQVILQGTSLKGMIRSVYEAITDSCLPLATVPPPYRGINAYSHDECKSLESLCPSCRLFGKIKGDELHCQGRVSFSDACLQTPDRLIQQTRFLKELSTPKSSHAGRKFYYHHSENPHFWVEEAESNKRSIAIEEYALPHAKFSFRIQLEYVEQEELRQLLLAVELTEGLGHKIGLGKPIGLGSCRIKVLREKSSLCWATARYQFIGNQQGTIDWSELTPNVQELLPALVKVLRLNKSEEGEIAYPSRDDYKEIKDIPAISTVQPLDSEKPLIPQQVCTSPQGSPPEEKPEHTAVWLKVQNGNQLVFVDKQGKEYNRKLSDFQGRKELLNNGDWYFLKGSKSVVPIKKTTR